MVREALTKLGYRVEAMSSPEDALALFKLNPGYFDVVITDMSMPKMTGITLAEKLFKIRPDIPVIICTGHSVMIDEKKAEQLGFCCLFGKACDDVKNSIDHTKNNRL